MTDLIERLSSKAPVATMFRAILERILGDDALNEIFRKHRQHQVESSILFSHLFGLVANVVTGAASSLNAAHQASGKTYSRQALYDKLKGVESEVSSALVRVTTEKLIALYDQTKATMEDPIKGFHTFVIDGKTFDATEHRLEESRTDARAPVPGRAIVILDTRTGMLVDIECSEQAFRCERKIVEPLLERQIKPGALYIADRNFSDGNLLSILLRSRSFFIIRHHGASPSWREIRGQHRVLKGKDEDGRSVYEQTIEVRLSDDTYVEVRRVTLILKKPNAKGETEVHFLTNLPNRIEAKVVASTYKTRWSIEICLGHLATALNTEIRTLCYPKAAGLCFAVGMLLYNVMNLIRLLLQAHAKPSKRYEIKNVSYYYMADEISRSQFAIEELIANSKWKVFASMGNREFARFLIKTASNAELERYRAHTRGQKKSKPKRKFTGTRHVATSKLLDERK